MKISDLRIPLVSLALAGLVASATVTAAAPVREAGQTILRPGTIPDGTIVVRNIRGRILFSGPARDYQYGKEIYVHPYQIEGGKVDVVIEGENGPLVSQRLYGLHNVEFGLFYNRSYGGFKVRNHGPVDLFLRN